MALHLVDLVRDDAVLRAPVACAIQFIYLDPLRGALALGGIDGVQGVCLASAFTRLPENPSSNWRVRLFDQHHHVLDERAVDAQQVVFAFGIDVHQRLAIARAAGPAY